MDCFDQIVWHVSKVCLGLATKCTCTIETTSTWYWYEDMPTFTAGGYILLKLVSGAMQCKALSTSSYLQKGNIKIMLTVINL